MCARELFVFTGLGPLNGRHSKYQHCLYACVKTDTQTQDAVLNSEPTAMLLSNSKQSAEEADWTSLPGVGGWGGRGGEK